MFMFADLYLLALFILKPGDLEESFSLCCARLLKLQPTQVPGDSLYLLGTLGVVVVVPMPCSSSSVDTQDE